MFIVARQSCCCRLVSRATRCPFYDYRPFSAPRQIRSAVNDAATKDSEEATSKVGGRQRRIPRSKTGTPSPPNLPSWFIERNFRKAPVNTWMDGWDGAQLLRLRPADDAQSISHLRIPFYPAKVYKEKLRPLLYAGLRPLGNEDQQTLQEDAEDKSTQTLEDQVEVCLQKAFDDRHFGDSTWSTFHLHLLVASSFLLARHDQARDRDAQFWPRHFVLAQDQGPSQHSTANITQRLNDIAALTGADVIELDANIIAELAGSYVDGPDIGPGAVSDLAFDAFEGLSAREAKIVEVGARGSPENSGVAHELPTAPKGLLAKVTKALMNRGDIFSSVSNETASEAEINLEVDDDNPRVLLSRQQALKLEAFFDNLLGVVISDGDAGDKQHPESTKPVLTSEQYFRELVGQSFSTTKVSEDRVTVQKALEHMEHWRAATYLPVIPLQVAQRIMSQVKDSTRGYTIEPFSGKLRAPLPAVKGSRTIIHVRDFGAIRATSQGRIIIQRLLKSVDKRRRNGEAVVMVGTSEVTAPDDLDDFLHVSINRQSPGFSSVDDIAKRVLTISDEGHARSTRIMEINWRNIQQHILALGVDVEIETLKEQKSMMHTIGAYILGRTVLTRLQVHELALFAHAFSCMYTTRQSICSDGIWIAIWLMETRLRSPKIGTVSSERLATMSSGLSKARVNIENVKKSCTSYEKRLVSGIRDASKITTTFADVHVPPSTIETIKTITGLSLSRPDAFKYGILARSSLSGMLLYGPPGTGKTMLAKAVAKDTNTTVLEVFGAQINDKFVGESEKTIEAVFSLAKKLTPCVVFIDEADALLSSRSRSERRGDRHAINQFLKEWDGMEDNNILIMVATNRPFDLDDAVLRRLSRKVLVDLPDKCGRAAILKILLKGEQLSDDVDLSTLAEQTPYFSGSDLRNVCVSAALAAVKEETTSHETQQDPDTLTSLPEKRTLTRKHFDIALQEISASISEDMSSLRDIKKFDEQFGEGVNRRAKGREFGFMGSGARANEDAIRVRV